ncbi:MAG: ATP-binding protein [Candidatus Desulfatibia sp.]|uniref:ATP-binding protein n=1 Tax=Candidatus Desulfatibia sp. TaxID=3101189 RepID=UPI002F3079EA
MKLQQMLIGLLTLYILLFVSISTVYFTHTQKKIALKNLEDSASSILKIMSISTSTQLFWSNYDKLNQYTQKIKETLTVKYVMIVNSDGTIIAHTDRWRIGEKVSLPADFKLLESTGILKKYNRVPKSTFTLSYPIFVINKIVGYIVLEHDMRKVEDEIRGIFKRGFLLAALLALIGILMSISSAYKITKPINQVMEGMDRIRRDEYDFKINLNSGPQEFRTLARAFNNMGAKLKYTIRKLDQERRQSETIITSISDGLMIIDTKRKIRFFNKGSEQILGYTQDEAIGRECTDIFQSPQCSEQTCGLFSDNGNGKTGGKKSCDIHNERINLVSRHGKQLVILKSTAPLIDSNGKIYGGVEVFKDITSLLAMENKLKESDRLASVGVLAAGMAHEINNPLTSIIGLSSGLIKRYKNDPFLSEDLEMIKDQGKRCGNIIKQLMDLSMEAPKTVAPVEISALLHGILRIITKTTPDIKMHIIEDYDPANPVVKADEAQLIQVFSNIIQNAIAATKGKGTLAISTKVIDSKVQITFKDDGKGIAPTHINRVCDPFYTTKKIGEGMGLGLAVSYGIIRHHNGELKIESKLGQGACFKIIFDVIATCTHVNNEDAPLNDKKEEL